MGEGGGLGWGGVEGWGEKAHNCNLITIKKRVSSLGTMNMLSDSAKDKLTLHKKYIDLRNKKYEQGPLKTDAVCSGLGFFKSHQNHDCNQPIPSCHSYWEKITDDMFLKC